MPYSNPESAPRLADLFSLKGRTALVIGGSGLLGGQISYAFAELGAELIIASRNQNRTSEFVATLKQQFPGLRAHALTVDITQPDSIKALMARTGELTNGGLDVLVNSGWSGRKNTFESISDEDWNNDIEVCLNGVFRCVKAATPMLKARRGNILSIASMYGHVAPDYRMYDSEKFSNPPSYGAAKAGVIQLTKYLASFLSVHGIRANESDDQRQSQMPRFLTDGVLTRAQVNDVAEHVLALSNRATDQAAAGRGAELYAENCASCHGEKGEGIRDVGAPRLSDQVWLYGGDKASIVQSISNARAGVMPSWGKRLDPAIINMLTVYVHSLGGGE